MYPSSFPVHPTYVVRVNNSAGAHPALPPQLLARREERTTPRIGVGLVPATPPPGLGVIADDRQAAAGIPPQLLAGVRPAPRSPWPAGRPAAAAPAPRPPC